MAPLQGQTENLEINANHNINPLSRSPSHNNNSTKIESKTIKHVVTNSSVVASTNTRSPSPHPTKTSNNNKNDIPEKEKKKRKESSSGRQKKFHRHFQQVAIDEKVINYYSCALVSDILLQGHLYITDNYFAFYSNVFGFVTKLLIPIISVVKISKEKTVKIIPNAIGVATADERHVFGSFMSREAAYRLMLSVWAPEPETIKNIPKIPDVEISECSIEEDSSSAISGNESPPHIQESTTSDDVIGRGGGGGGGGGGQHQSPFNTSTIDSGVVLRNKTINVGVDVDADDDDDDENHENIPYIHGESLNLSSPPPVVSSSPLLISGGGKSSIMNIPTSVSSTTTTTILQSSTIGSNSINTASSSASASAAATTATATTFVLQSQSQKSSKMDKVVAATSRYFKFPTTFHIVYLGVFFVIILSMFSGYLLYRIIDIQAKTNQFSPLDFKWSENQDVDIYADVLKWQKEMQSKSVDEAQIILNSNLEQIAKVRKSLETLSILIHDKNAPNLPDTSSENCISVGVGVSNVATSAGGCGIIGDGHSSSSSSSSSLNVNINNVNENNKCDPGIS